MATSPEPQIGTKVYIVAAVPAAETVSAYAALSWVELKKVLSVPEIAENSQDQSLTLLSDGLTQHFNGALGIDPFDIPYVFVVDDAGQVIVRANKNGATEIAVKIDYVNSSKIKYLTAVLANLRTNEATPNSFHGETINVRPITLAVTDLT